MATSIITLAYISIDRYLNLCRRSIGQNKGTHPKYIIIIIWLATALFFTPFSMYCHHRKGPLENACDCESRWPSANYYEIYSHMIVILGFFVPFTAILFCYSKVCVRLFGRSRSNDIIPNDPTGSKRRSIKMLLLATTLFFVSWFPYSLLYMMKKASTGDPKIIR